MSDADDDLVCPECGGPIGMTSTYCMHCSADLTDERNAADADDDGVWDDAEIPATGGGDEPAGTARSRGMETGDQTRDAAGESGEHASDDRASHSDANGDHSILDPDGIVDNTLTVVVGILGGIVVGLVGTIVLLVITGSGWALLFGLAAWLGSTAYLVRRRTVQGAISRGGYAVAVVFLLIPFVAVSPVVRVQGGLAGRVQGVVVLLVMVGVPAAISAVVGFVAGRFVPEGADGSVD